MDAADIFISPAGPMEIKFRRRDGSEGVCLSTVFRIPSSGNEASFVGMHVDLTERKQAEAALKQKTEELDRYFITSPDLLCIADTDITATARKLRPIIEDHRRARSARPRRSKR